MVSPEANVHKATNYYKIKLATNEPYTPKQNCIAEGTIGHMRQHWLDIRQQKQVSPRLWDFRLVWIAEIMSRTFWYQNRRTGIEVVIDGYDEYIGAELLFDFLGDDATRGQVIKCAKGKDGQPIGKWNINTILDSRMYNAQLSDGSHHELSANIRESVCTSERTGTPSADFPRD
jgi:hypothetical protein